MPLYAPTPANIVAIAGVLQAGELAALPTETVYGLAADATNPAAVLKIYAAKGRPRFNPLIIHLENLGAAQHYGVFSPTALKLAEAFWPGPLTLVVPVGQEAVPDLVRAGLPSIAIRVPGHPLMQAVLRAVGCPLAAPSANKSGHVSATQAAHVAADFGDDLAILDGGPCEKGLESTIVDCTTATPTLLRAGALPRAEIEAVLGHPLALPAANTPAANTPEAPKAPGMLLKHYAPQAPVRLNATHLNPGEALLGFGDMGPVLATLQAANPQALALNLSPVGNLAEAALNLFAMLRALDAAHPTGIAVMPIPATGLGEAIADRLGRAAQGR